MNHPKTARKKIPSILVSSALVAILLAAPAPAFAQIDDGPGEPGLASVTDLLWSGVQALWGHWTTFTTSDPAEEEESDATPLTFEPTVDDGTAEALPIVDPAGYL